MPLSESLEGTGAGPVHKRSSRKLSARSLVASVLPAPWRFHRWVPPYLDTLAVKRTGNRVMEGPFAGLRLPRESFWSVHTAKLVGCYERELHAAVEEIIRSQPRVLVNIGAAEGYYAVGFALRLPGTRICAFEAAEEARLILSETIRLNGLAERVKVLGVCEVSGLRDTLESAGYGEAVVFCDCEGAESILLDLATVPELTRCVIVVETHDFLVPGVGMLIEKRFSATHQIDRIAQVPRSSAEFPFRSWVTVLTPAAYRAKAVSERRPAANGWLLLRPIGPTGI